MAYQGFRDWPDGVYDVRAYRYEHPWIAVVHGSAHGGWTRDEARAMLRELRADVSARGEE